MTRTVLITGASSGIGRASALAAAQAGWQTVATLRDPSGAASLTAEADRLGLQLDIRRLDVAELGAAERCVAEVIAQHGRLDAVVNNAGIGHVGTIELDELDAVRAVFEVNFFGVVELTKHALPHLRASSGRLVTVSSIGGAVGQPFNEAYCAAKFAVEGFMESLAPVAAGTGVSVGLLEPGPVATQLGANSNSERDAQAVSSGDGPYAAMMGRYIERIMATTSPDTQQPAEVAAVLMDMLTAESMPFRVQSSEWVTRFLGRKLADLDGAAIQRLTTRWIAE